MIWWFYNLVFAVVFLLMLPRFLWRMWRRGGYGPAFAQRLGLYDKSVREKLAARPEKILIHAVSVGELQVALRFMETVREARPGAAFVLTTTTSTAHRLAQKALRADDVLLYFPVDFPGIVRRALRQINPRALILVESELWPNLVRQMAARSGKIMLLNGRISNRSFRRYRFGRPLVRRVLAGFDILCAQSAEDQSRLLRLGAAAGRVKMTGSAKYDIAAAPFNIGHDFIKKLAALGFGPQRLLLVGGSTWPGEEAALLEIYARLRPKHERLKLVLVPRHAERRQQVAAEIEKFDLRYKLWSQCRPAGGPPEEADVLLVDTTGELRAFYAVAAVVFVGKSLTARGGQNPIEAAVCSKPVVVGPHTENFSGVIADFLAAQAILQVDDRAELEGALISLLADENARRLLGARAAQVVLKKSGAIRASAELFLQ